ncbi:hypothetical protein PsorP6_008077 [Peronosclerospora sorghi]|uniref:Uncharacterized protein n=1 Tax=Peronosclerospora sorghi TaxID=230839 RepID=A0ACC0W889_9STRA|nr:hypothetical protein PsorP6_008077 [Peronosclerospora sorghi]
MIKFKDTCSSLIGWNKEESSFSSTTFSSFWSKSPISRSNSSLSSLSFCSPSSSSRMSHRTLIIVLNLNTRIISSKSVLMSSPRTLRSNSPSSFIEFLMSI